jgi:hypothetical protein
MIDRSKADFPDQKRATRPALLFLVFLLLLSSFALCQDEFDGAERIVAVGDVHGGFEDLVAILRMARIVDGRNRWIGGKAYLVQTGDLLDRGPDSRKVLDLLMDLESQAQKAGGMVQVLLGNHEAMNIYGDLRYVSRGEYDSYRSPESERLRDQVYEATADPGQKTDRKYRRKWEDDHPLGWVEHRQAFDQTGRYGKWLRQKNVVIRVNNALFSHGGISPKYASLSLREMNEQCRAELRDFAKIKGGMVIDPQGPLWYRGLAEAPESELAPHVEALLAAYKVKYIVIAHTPTPGVILPRFGGKVIQIDVGLSRVYGEARACLLFEGSEPFALHRGSRLPLPTDGDILAYLRRAESLEPYDSPLRRYASRRLRGQPQ